jgi:bacterioferritin-associated ferredoxin
MRIDKCYCFDVKFSEIKDFAARNTIFCLQELKLKCGFGTACQICEPYVKETLQTGKIVFTEIIKNDRRTD